MADLLARTAAALTGEMTAIAGHLVERMLEEIPELDGDPVLTDLLAASVADNIRVAMDRFAAGEREADPPATALEYARRLARHDIPVSALLRAYRLGQAECQQLMIEAFARDTDDPAAIVAATVEFSAATFAYIDRLSEQVVQAHRDERRRWLTSGAATRTAQVAAILTGDPLEAGQAERLLGYPLDGRHLGLVAWCDPDPGLPDVMEREVRRIAGGLGCVRDPLVVSPDLATLWAWLPLPRDRPDPHLLATSTPGIRLGVGEPGTGADGFRATHRQARTARDVALSADVAARTAITSFADAGLVALLRADLTDLATWVRDVLGPLATDDEQHARLRETVRAWLAHSGSHTAAAAELSVHRNTVLYRVRKAEEVRGRPLSEGRLDVEVALQVCRVLGRPVLC